MLPVRSYSVRMKRRNRETEASFRKSLYRRRGAGSNDGTPADSPQTPIRRTFSTRTGPLRSSLRSTASSVGTPVRTVQVVSASERKEEYPATPRLQVQQPGDDADGGVTSPQVIAVVTDEVVASAKAPSELPPRYDR